jgi:tetrahydromethanopterin S-methyltransferase subunit C
MAHSAEIIGLAAFNIVGAILDELDARHPGIKAEILNRAKTDATVEMHRNPGGNAAAILEVIKLLPEM